MKAELEHDTVKVHGGGAIELDDNDSDSNDNSGHAGGSNANDDSNDNAEHSTGGSKDRIRKQAKKVRANQKKYDKRAGKGLGAEAYAKDTDVYTARGGEGTSFIGHELSHVTQQGGGS